MIVELIRASDDEKKEQLEGLTHFKTHNAQRSSAALKGLQSAALSGENVFELLMETAKVCSLGQMTEALFEVGGQYRRSV